MFIVAFVSCRLLVGAPYETNGPYQTGDVYKCSLSKRANGNGCSKLNLGTVTTLLSHTLTGTWWHVQDRNAVTRAVSPRWTVLVYAWSHMRAVLLR